MISLNIKVFLLVFTVALTTTLTVMATPQITDLTVSGPDSNGKYTVSANINNTQNSSATPAPLAGKQATMFVYNGTPSDSTIITTDQDISDESGNVSFSFGTDSSTPIGKYTILVGGEDVYSAVSTTLTIPSTPYIVTFKDWDGTILKTQNVNYGMAATAPNNPSRTGYRFIGWDAVLDNIFADTTVTALYSLAVKPSPFALCYDFETDYLGGKPAGLNVNEKAIETGGNISVAQENNNRFLKMNILRPQNPTAPDSFVDTPYYFPCNKVRVSFRAKVSDINGGTFKMQFRTQNAQFFEILNFSNATTMKAFTYNSAYQVTQSIQADIWHNVMLILNYSEQSITILLDGNIVGKNSFPANFKDATINNSYLVRLSQNCSTAYGTTSLVYVDDLIIDNDYSLSDDVLVMPYSISKNVFTKTTPDVVDFQNQTVGNAPVGLNVYENANEAGGSISVQKENENNYAAMKIQRPINPTSNESYMQTKYYLTDETAQISFSVRPQNLLYAQLNLSMRTFDGQNLTLAKFSQNSFEAFSDWSSSDKITTQISTNAWNNVTIVFNYLNKTFTIGLNNQTLGTKPFTANYLTYVNPNNYCLVFDHVYVGTTSGSSEVDVDNITIYNNPNFPSITSYNSDGYATSNNRISGFAKNYTNKVQNLKMLTPVYSSNKVVSVSLQNIQLQPNETQVLSNYIFNAPNSGNVLKTFFWKDNNLFPVTVSQGYGKHNTDIPYPDDITSLLKSYSPNNKHPRLLSTQSRFDELKRLYGSNSTIKNWCDGYIGYANTILTYTPMQRTLYDGFRMNCQNNEYIAILAFAYKLTGEQKYIDKVMEYARALAAYSDWNVNNQFLDTAIMANGVAFAYDCCYDALTDQQRAVIRTALRNQILIPAYKAYINHAWWSDGTNNWTAVCNGGILMSALAVADEPGYEELSGYLIANAVKSLRNFMPQYAPDGAWVEGPGYWELGFQYIAKAISSLDNSLGTNFSLFNFEGVSQSGYYPIYLTGTTKYSFNLADGDACKLRIPEIGWLGAKAQNNQLTQYRYYQLKNGEFLEYRDLLWLDLNILNTTPQISLPLDKYFRGDETATFRTSFTDTNGAYLAVHGGQNNASHGQLDIGNFIYEVLGQRFAIDLGLDDYNLYNYFDSSRYRWWYYRNRAEAHNTIILNPQAQAQNYQTSPLNILCDQDLDGFARVSDMKSGIQNSFAVIDTSSAYKSAVNYSKRGVMLYKDTGVAIIQDEISFKSTSDLYWFMNTGASISVAADKKSAILTQCGQSVWLGIISNGNEIIEVQNSSPLPNSPNPDTLSQNIANGKTQNTNSGIKKIVIKNHMASGLYNLSVAMVPLTPEQSTAAVIPSYSPILNWTAK